MSDMQRISMWWLFLVLFGLTIGGIQSLGWWTRAASAETTASTCDPYRTEGARRHRACQSKHWRSVFMHQ